MEQCYEYLACGKTDCVMHGQDRGVKCWEVPNTLCNNPGRELLMKRPHAEKEEICRLAGCLYYRAAKAQEKWVV